MHTLMSSSLMVYTHNRRLQRKANAGFTKVGLPLAKKTGELLEPVSPIVVKRFQAQLDREVQRRQMATGLLLILLAGISAAACLYILGHF